MDNSIIVALITVFGSIVIGSFTFYLTKRHETAVKWQAEKLNHYKVLISSISDLAIDDIDKNDASLKFALAVNTIALVAPQYVIKALMDFHDEVKFSNPNPTREKHDELLTKLLLSIRKDIGLAKNDNYSSFNFHLIGTKPTGNKINKTVI